MRTRSKPNQRLSQPLREGQQRLLEQSLSLLCIGGLDGYLKRIDPAIADALGYSQEEMLSQPMIELVHPDDRADSVHLLDTFAQGREVGSAEVRILAKDGSYKWVLWKAVPCPEEGVFLATGQDITQRKAIEEALRESQERFQLIATATDEAVWDWDLRSGRIWHNEAYHKAFGPPLTEAEGILEWWRQRVHPDDLERVLDRVAAPIVDGHQQWTIEYRLQRRDGTYACVYDRGFVIFGSDGQPVRMVGSLMDVSKLKRAEAELRASEARFRLAARATRDVIFDWDIRGGRVWRSEGFEAVFGYAADEVPDELGWWLEHTHPEDRDRVCAQIAEVHAQRMEHHATEYRFRRADGSYADVYESAFVMYDEQGRPLRMVGSMMDISQRRRAEEMIAMQQAELAHIARVSTMGEIATGLAHELNQPLAVIANYAESCLQALSADSPGAQDKLREYLEKIAANTHRAGEIIRGLRSFTRKGKPHREVIEVDELVREVIDLVDPETRRRRMRIRWKPQSAGSVVADRVQIQQVLVNLLYNAYEAAAGLPSDRRSVTIAAATDGDFAEIAVADSGRGIAHQHVDTVFDAFFTTKPSGVGVGLAISRSIVSDHGGRLWLAENSPQGVTFRFRLPSSGVQHGGITHRNGR
ncbi:MAG: PAS domain-containing protein [Pirellulales bacterium]